MTPNASDNHANNSCGNGQKHDIDESIVLEGREGLVELSLYCLSLIGIYIGVHDHLRVQGKVE